MHVNLASLAFQEGMSHPKGIQLRRKKELDWSLSFQRGFGPALCNETAHTSLGTASTAEARC